MAEPVKSTRRYESPRRREQAAATRRVMLDAADPARKLRLVAHNSRRVKERAGALMAVIRSAAASDADIAALWDRIQADFHDNQRAIVQTLHDAGALRRGLGVERGADL